MYDDNLNTLGMQDERVHFLIFSSQNLTPL